MPLPALIPLAAAAGPALTAARVGAHRLGPAIGRGIQAIFDKPSAPAGFGDALQETLGKRAEQALPKGTFEDLKKFATSGTPRNEVVARSQAKARTAQAARKQQLTQQRAAAQAQGQGDVPLAQAQLLDERVAARQGVQAIPTVKGTRRKKRGKLPGPQLAGL